MLSVIRCLDQPVRIASWNVNSVRTRLEQVLAWLNREEPDLLCLQETKVNDASFPLDAFQQHGWHVSIHGQKAYNGVALVSRAPLDDVRCGFVGELPEDPRGQALDLQKRCYEAQSTYEERKFEAEKSKPSLLGSPPRKRSAKIS